MTGSNGYAIGLDIVSHCFYGYLSSFQGLVGRKSRRFTAIAKDTELSIAQNVLFVIALGLIHCLLTTRLSDANGSFKLFSTYA